MSAILERLRAVARHRLAKWFVLGAVILLVVRVVAGLPSTVEVSYHLGAAGDGLQRLALRYVGEDGEQVRRAAFSYTSEAPGEVQVHQVQLLPGDYRVEVDLAYAAGKAERISRPLIVRGSGKVSVFLDR